MSDVSKGRWQAFFVALGALLALVPSAVYADEQPDELPLWARNQKEFDRNNGINLSRLLANREQVRGIEVIIAAEGTQRVYSRWGHALLRFVGSGYDWTDDIVISFVANVDEPTLSLRKGITGGYRVLPMGKTLGEFWSQYIEEESRPLYRYIIPTNQKMRFNIMRRLQDWIDHPELMGNYTFFSNNCAGALAHLIEDAAFPHKGSRPLIPTRIHKWLEKSLLSPYPKTVIEARPIHDAINQAAQILAISPKELVMGERWPEDAATRIKEAFDDATIKRLLLEVTLMPQKTYQELVKEHRFGNGGATLEDVVSFKDIPPQFYETCRNISCGEAVLKLESSLFLDSDLRAARQLRGQIYDATFSEDRLYKDLKFYKTLIQNSALMSHFQMLVTLERNPEIATDQK